MFLPYKTLVNRTFIGLRNLSTTRALAKNHYEVLGVSRDATQAEIKNAYFKLTKIYHPDRIAATDENLKKFREISEAYEILGNDQSRKLYDTGFLGDVKRVGAESVESTDPIISFYKQRQDMAKILQTKPDSLGIWTQSHYAESKHKQQHDLFSMKTTRGLMFHSPVKDLKMLGYCLVIMFLLLSNFEGTNAEKIWNRILNFRFK